MTLKSQFEELGYICGEYDETADCYEENYPEINYNEYHDSTYHIVSKFGYLIGVPIKGFEKENASLKKEIYDELSQNRNARIIRNLCMIRTAFEKNYNKIYEAFKLDLKNITSLPELIPQEAIKELLNDGIDIYKANCSPSQYIININTHINNRINNCKDIFPIWLNWDYIKDLFIMPNGTNEAGIKRAAQDYYEHRSSCPYGVYMNWSTANKGYILICDKKFVKLLYEYNEDCFDDLSKVSDAGLTTKEGIYDFLENSNKVNIVVDCENSDPYRLYAMLNNLDEEALLSKINKITLYDDAHTTSAWDVLGQFTKIQVEHIEIDRVLEEKSLVDARLIAGTTKEIYKNDVDAIILASSDSDYWAMISEIPEANFLIVIESEKCSPIHKRNLEDNGYMYCYLDNFCTGNSNQLKETAVLNEIQKVIDAVCFNINDALNNAYISTRADMSEAEKRQFYNKYIKSMRLVTDSDGNVTIKLGN